MMTNEKVADVVALALSAYVGQIVGTGNFDSIREHLLNHMDGLDIIADAEKDTLGEESESRIVIGVRFENGKFTFWDGNTPDTWKGLPAMLRPVLEKLMVDKDAELGRNTESQRATWFEEIQGRVKEMLEESSEAEYLDTGNVLELFRWIASRETE